MRHTVEEKGWKGEELQRDIKHVRGDDGVISFQHKGNFKGAYTRWTSLCTLPWEFKDNENMWALVMLMFVNRGSEVSLSIPSSNPLTVDEIVRADTYPLIAHAK